MKPTPLATFTPSLVDPETLERLFVTREPVLADLVKRASKAMTGRTRAHRLLVGPHGAGKTHLLVLAHHRISHLEPRPTIAWLAEDPWRIDDYADLLREILEASSNTERRNRTGPGRLSSDALETELRNVASEGGPIVVLAENFDRILGTIHTDGQRRLRRFMENDRALLLLVTATRLTSGLLHQDGPFYGFFSTFELPPLTVDQAAKMLARIAAHRGDEALAARLRAPVATDRHRLAAIDALAGGQPRVWALLASALTVDGLDSPAEVLLTRFDDLTPYYQEQLGRLSPRERKVVRTLADLDRALNVKEFAEELGLDQKSLAKTLSTLRHEGWLSEVPIPLGAGDARKTYFELAEPLARLAFQLKDNRGEAIPLLVTFLATWFSRAQLESPFGELSDLARQHLEAALRTKSLFSLAETFGIPSANDDLAFIRPHLSPTTPALPDSSLSTLADALAALSRKETAPYLSLAPTTRRVLLQAIEERGIEGAQRLCIRLGSNAADWIVKAERLAESGSESIANRRLVAELYLHAGRHDAAITLLDSVVSKCLETHGPFHPCTLDTRLARLQAEGSARDRLTASMRFEALLGDCIHALGEVHQLTVMVRSATMMATVATDFSRALQLQRQNTMIMRDIGQSPFHELSIRLLMVGIADKPENDTQVSRLLDETLADAVEAFGLEGDLVLSIRQFIAIRTARAGNVELDPPDARS